MRLQGMDLNSFFVDTVDSEAIKVGSMPTIKTSFLVMALYQKLLRPSFKSYANNISLCQACCLKLKFPWLKIFQVFRPLHYKDCSACPFYPITWWHVMLYLENNICLSTAIQTVQVQWNTSSYSLAMLGWHHTVSIKLIWVGLVMLLHAKVAGT